MFVLWSSRRTCLAGAGAWNQLGNDHDRDAVTKLLQLIHGLPPPIPSRAWLVEYAKEAGFSVGVAAWLGSSLKRMDAGQHGELDRTVPTRESLTWSFDATTASELLQQYAACDSWDVLETPAEACASGDRVSTQLVVAEQSSRWTADFMQKRLAELEETCHKVYGYDRRVLHRLPRSGHWMHVDNPAGLAGVLAPAF